MSRLHLHIKPEKYILNLRPDLEKFTFTGEETIQFTIDHPTKELTFHAVDLDIHSAVLEGSDAQKIENISYATKDHTVTFHFVKELLPGKKVLSLTFSGVLPEKMKGFYRSRYTIDGKEKVMATTQFEEIGARQAFVSIDEPSAKAVFDITLTVPQHLEAVSNTIAESIEEYDDRYKSVHFAPTPKMSTYLVAFIVGELEYIEQKTSEGVTIRAFATPDKKDQLRFALDVAVKVLSFYQKYFDIAYPLPVLDMIAIADFDAGAMENWGAVTFREAALLVDEEKSSLINKQWVALVVAHELAHMWFGNLVTMEWWTHLWLNEGFACYIEYLAIDTLFPEWEMWKQFTVMEHNDALSLDSLNSTHPIEMQIADDKNVKEIFDEISYAKGASIIQMIATYLGPETFRDGLRYYLKKHAYQNTTTEDLWEAFEYVSKQDVKTIMQNWTQTPGYPIITMSGSENVQLSQTRFFSNRSIQKEGINNQIWQVPLKIAMENGEKIPYLLEGKTASLPKEWHFKIINSDETSFTRVLYTDDHYQQLSKYIENKTLSAIDRMGIIRDLFDSASSGFISSTVALSLLSSYTNEDEYIVWATIIGGLNALNNILFGTKNYVDFQQFVTTFLSNIVEKVGWEKNKNETIQQTMLRGMILFAAGKYGNKDVVAHARKLFADYFEENILIDSDIRGAIFMLVAKNGTEEDWDRLVELFTRETLHQEKNRIMLALCNFSDEKLLQKTLEWSLSGKVEFQAEAVRLQDKSRILLAMFGNPYGQKVAWEFLKEHWTEFEKMYQGLHGLSRVIEGAGDMVGQDILSDVKDFFAHHKNSGVEMVMHQVIEKIDANTAWQLEDGAKIGKLLKKI